MFNYCTVYCLVTLVYSILSKSEVEAKTCTLTLLVDLCSYTYTYVVRVILKKSQTEANGLTKY